ncbi:LytR family transcriptional regulator [Agromyces sp. MMS17-SY077]|uniref:LytR family transcriptional regulator n=2 Tax=Agromyces seonyuensis TaxID=2662446 RepID=A0A6I4P002_9MICO|nr:LCP family protein [Agromyces seonyuensis]MWB99876.1 LytR family transcriptional regulator [Agromyces seonyuensis]
MTMRGWWLVALNLLIPGSAQVLAGNRRLGRFGLGATLVLWTLAVLAIVSSFLWRATLISIVTNPFVLWLLAAGAAFYAVLWIVLTLDTLRLVRFVKVAPGARPLIAGFTALALLLVAGSAGYGAVLATSASGFLSSVFTAAPPVDPIDGRYNFLLLGGDSGPDRDGMRPDSTSVVSVDAETGDTVIIGIPRDLLDAPFPADSPMHERYPDGYGANGCEVDVCQFNSIYTEVELYEPQLYPDAEANGSSPGIEAVRDASEGVTGLTIQYYALIDMQGFSELVDALGGVDVDVQSDVPIHADETFTTVAEWIYAGPQHLDGYHALWFARSRHGSSDYDRMARQRQLQEAIVQQFTPANVLAKFQSIAAAGSQTVRTDVPQSMLGPFVDLADKARNQPITTVELVPPNVEPDEPDYEYIGQLIDAALNPPETEAPAG